ncbi:MAG: GNAT family N-acetyltransferase, partial [Moorella sp. (in: Bacteria)]|nr:GNAT family N-acetyltransferase [Moorella sp. (in: firmicutes)]
RGTSFRRGFLVCSRDLNSLLGYISLEDISWKKGSAELRAFMKYRGKGYGQDAIATVLDYVFSSTPLKQLYLKVSVKNTRAIACYLKCGFKVEGILKAGRRSRDGLEDLYLMVAERPPAAAARCQTAHLRAAPGYPPGLAVPVTSTP